MVPNSPDENVSPLDGGDSLPPSTIANTPLSNITPDNEPLADSATSVTPGLPNVHTPELDHRLRQFSKEPTGGNAPVDDPMSSEPPSSIMRTSIRVFFPSGINSSRC
jgi:hypothetical protein